MDACDELEISTTSDEKIFITRALVAVLKSFLATSGEATSGQKTFQNNR